MTENNNKKQDVVWPEVEVVHPPELTEAVAEILFSLGAVSLVQEEGLEKENYWKTRAGFKPGTPLEQPARNLEKRLDDLKDIFKLSEPLQAEWMTTTTGDWAEKWKEGLEPIEIDDVLVIKPTWRSYAPRTGRIILELDPGMAFGTGRHESTYMCLKLLVNLYKSTGLPEAGVLDLGTGSGILAMALAALGVNIVTAVDNDPQTMPVAVDNLTANGLQDRVRLVCAGPEAIKGEYDLILANLTSGVLIDLSMEISRLASDNSRLILSGILISQAEEVIDCYNKLGFVLSERSDMGEWTAMMLEPEKAS